MIVGVGVVCVLVTLSVLSALRDSDTALNMHAVQADSFLRGDLELDRALEDSVVYGEQIFSPYPPAPALLLVPFVAVFGDFEPLSVGIAILLSAAGVVLAWRIASGLGLSRNAAAILVAGLFLGTAYWNSLLEADTIWYFSHVVAFTALLASIERALRGRALAAGIWLAVAVLSRQLTVFAVPFVLALLYQPRQGEPRRSWRDLAVLAVPLTVGGVVQLTLNSVRFAGPLDTGYAAIVISETFLAQRVAEHGLFSLAYVPFNFDHLFLRGPQLNWTGPENLEIGPTDPFGTSITFASPFLFFAALARVPRRVVIAGWMSIGLILAGILTYYNNGFVQLNAQRFTLDLLPIVFVLLVLGIQRTRTNYWIGAVAFSIGLNVVMISLIPSLT